MHVFSIADPGTWADWALVLVGLGGTWAAVQTVIAIKKQAEDASQDSIRLNRAYLVVDAWVPEASYTGYDVGDGKSLHCSLGLKFRIFNPSRTPARVDTVSWTMRQVRQDQTVGTMLPQNGSVWIEIPTIEAKGNEVVTVLGTIKYRDVFRRHRQRRFAKTFICSSPISVHDTEGDGLNDEVSWETV